MSSGWCPDHAICVEWIERRALERLENFQDVDTVYMSLDVYRQFMEHMERKCRITPTHSSAVGMTIDFFFNVGALDIKPVSHFMNFCHVGTARSYEQLEWEQVGRDFEEIVLKDCETE